MKSKWDNIKHFSEKENWGNPDKMNPFLLQIMDIIREEGHIPISIHNGYSKSGHATHSQHYLGNACDWHFVTNIPFKQQYLLVKNILENQYLGGLELSNLVGLGLYFYWNNQGFHLDCRGYKARWMQDKKGKYKEINLNELV